MRDPRKSSFSPTPPVASAEIPAPLHAYGKIIRDFLESVKGYFGGRKLPFEQHPQLLKPPNKSLIPACGSPSPNTPPAQ